MASSPRAYSQRTAPGFFAQFTTRRPVASTVLDPAQPVANSATAAIHEDGGQQEAHPDRDDQHEVNPVANGQQGVDGVKDNQQDVDGIKDNRQGVDGIKDNRQGVDGIKDNRQGVDAVEHNQQDVDAVKDNQQDADVVGNSVEEGCPVLSILWKYKAYYLVAWAENDPETGKRYLPTWVPVNDVTKTAVEEWEASKTLAKERIAKKSIVKVDSMNKEADSVTGNDGDLGNGDWELVGIRDEDDHGFKVQWRGIERATGQPWPEQWIAKTDVNPAALRAWEKVRAAAAGN